MEIKDDAVIILSEIWSTSSLMRTYIGIAKKRINESLEKYSANPDFPEIASGLKKELDNMEGYENLVRKYDVDAPFGLEMDPERDVYVENGARGYGFYLELMSKGKRIDIGNLIRIRNCLTAAVPYINKITNKVINNINTIEEIL